MLDHRRRLRRSARRRPAARGRHRRHPHRREGRRLRRHVVLEPLPRRRRATSSRTSTCRCSRRSATSRKEKYSQAAEILAHSRAIGEHFDLYRNACFQTEVTEMRWDDADGRWIVRDEPRRRDAGPLRLHGERAAAPPEAARHPRHRDVPGPHVPHQPLGLRLHRRRLRRAASPAWPASGSASSAPAPPRCSACRTSARRPSSCTCSSARRRRSTCAPTAPPTRSGRRRSSPAGRQRRMENFNNLVTGHPRAGGPRQRRLDRHHRQAADPAARGGGRRCRRDGAGRDDGAGRLREDGADPRPRRHDRQRPEHGRGAEAVLPPVLQAAVLPRRVPRHVQPAQRHAGRHRRARRRAHHRARRRRRAPTPTGTRRGRVRARLPHLRHRLRGRHRLHPPRRATSCTGATADADREVGRRRLDAARHAQHGLPELLHLQPRAVGLHGELPAHAQRAEQAPRLHPRARPPIDDVDGDRGAAGGRGRRGCDDDRRPGPDEPSTSSSRARPATTTTRASPSERGVRNGFYGAGSIAFVKVLEDWRADGSLAGLDLV